jgi:2-polyprenyl-3-methyl-5-hydroxy-6-metoxy-1,4-benzoquinol methylase
VKPKEHWESIYASKAPDEHSWFQPQPTVSLDVIRRVAPRTDAAIIDVGGGASTLVDALLSLGYTRLTVSDIAAAGLRRAQARLGAAAATVSWRCADVLEDAIPAAGLDVWREQAVRPNGHVIIGTFVQDGPQRCSGLSVAR